MLCLGFHRAGRAGPSPNGSGVANGPPNPRGAAPSPGSADCVARSRALRRIRWRNNSPRTLQYQHCRGVAVRQGGKPRPWVVGGGRFPSASAEDAFDADKDAFLTATNAVLTHSRSLYGWARTGDGERWWTAQFRWSALSWPTIRRRGHGRPWNLPRTLGFSH
jgi:hypothetical protein